MALVTVSRISLRFPHLAAGRCFHCNANWAFLRMVIKKEIQKLSTYSKLNW